MTSQTFKWVRKAAGRWMLQAADGQIAAVVTPSGYDNPRSPKFKTTVMGVARNHSSIAKYGKPHWTTGYTVKSAQKAVEHYIARHSWETVTVSA